MRERKLVDPVNGNTFRIVLHEGFVFLEVGAKHGDTVVYTSLRVSTDVAMPVLRGMLLS